MRVILDRAACSGHARCFALAPEVYDIDDEGFNSVDQAEVPPEFEQQARDGAEACPEQAIAIEP